MNTTNIATKEIRDERVISIINWLRLFCLIGVVLCMVWVVIIAAQTYG